MLCSFGFKVNTEEGTKVLLLPEEQPTVQQQTNT